MNKQATSREFTCRNEKNTQALAAAVAAQLRPGDILCLRGPLGSGKTTFTRHVVHALGANQDMVSSPTFVICHEYHIPEMAVFTTIAHIDAYRLTSPDDIASIGFDELLADPHVLIMIEWPERIASAIPHERSVHLDFAHSGADFRTITIAMDHTRLCCVAEATADW